MEQEAKRKGNPVLEVLIAIVVVACLVLLGFLGWRRFGPALAAPTPSLTPPRAVVGLWEAYGQARALVQAQVPDAQLVSASTQWRVTDEEALLSGASDWSFVFYSPAASSVVDVGVSAEAAQVVKQTQVWVAPTVMTGRGWEKGPGDALSVFLAYGGRTFLEQHPEALVDLHLMQQEGGRPAWAIVALDAVDQAMLSVLVDTENSVVLQHTS